MSRSPTVVALISGCNDEDVVAQVVRALVADGVQVYYLDQQSADRTVAEVEPFRGRGVVGMELIPPSDPAEESDGSACAERTLKRKEELVRELDADWFLHGDADEFYESPWSGHTLLDGIRRVDSLEYNAIAFHGFNFLPSSDDPAPGADIRNCLQYYEPAWVFNRQQIVCWKKTRQPVALAASGGYSVQFAGRRIFPIRFLLRHYPVRRDRFVPEASSGRADRSEGPRRAEGWRVYDDGPGRGASFLRDQSALSRYDPDLARLQLWLTHREFEQLQRVAAASGDEADRLTDERAPLLNELGALRARLAEREDMLGQVMSSRSWKLTASLRAIDRLMRPGRAGDK